MPGELIYTTSILINAQVATTWQVLTDPVAIRQFYFGIDWKTNWQKGDPIIFSGMWDHQYIEDKGNILDIEKEKFILFNYWISDSGTADIPENYTKVQFDLGKDNDTTLFTVSQYGFKNEEDFKTVETKWKGLCYQLKEIVEQVLPKRKSDCPTT